MAQKWIPQSCQDALAIFDHLTNRLKLEYLWACCTSQFNLKVIGELQDYYDREAQVAGGMNEAFRWFLGNMDVEAIEALPGGEPFTEKLEPRKGTGLLFTDFDPRQTATYKELVKANDQIIKAYQQETSLEAKVAIMAEYMAIKVTCHDLFIHGRSSQPAPHLFEIPFVHIDPANEANYTTKVLKEGLNDFRLKNIFSYAMACGLDPVSCLTEKPAYLNRERSDFVKGIREILNRLDEVDPCSYFRWDIYGICNFLEGPVFLRKDKTNRCMATLAQAFENYIWRSKAITTETSDYLAREAFSIIFDHSKIVKSNLYHHFSSEANREHYLPVLKESICDLDRLANK